MNAAHTGRKLAGLALVGTAALAGSANAATVIVGTDIDVVGAGTGSLNLDGAGAADDITFTAVDVFWTGVNVNVPAGQLVFTGGDVARLGVTTEIGPASNWGSSSGNLANKFGGGQWYNQRRGYVGLRFTATDGQTHYGWADITARATPNAAFHVYGYGYENSANTPISTPTPEPSSIALMALGAAGVLALKRRRRKSA